jgi:hypothetical protein
LIDPNVIDAMVATGCTAEQIAAVVKADAHAEIERIAAKREADRIRKREQRARESATKTTLASAMSRGQAVTPQDNADTPPPPKESPQTPKEITPTTLKEKTPKGVQKKGSRLPDDFAPDFEFALRAGLTHSQAQTEFAKFRDYWAAASGQAASKADWQAAWRYWIRNAVERRGNQRAGPSPKLAPIDHFRNYATEISDGQIRDDRGDGGDWDDAPGVPLRAIQHHG